MKSLNSNSNLFVVKNSLEKILKALLIKMRSGDDITVPRELIWYDELIYKIYKLKETHYEKFVSLVDPDSQFKKIQAVNIGEIDWSKVKVVEGATTTAKTGEITDERLYRLSLLQSHFNLLDTFFLFSSKVWEEGVNIENFDAAWRGTYSIGNLYSNIAFGTDTANRFDFVAYYDFFLQKLRSRVNLLLTKGVYNARNNGYIKFLMITVNVDHFIKDPFPSDRYALWRKNVFLNLKMCIDRGHSKFVREMIRDLSGKNVTPGFQMSSIFELRDFVEQRVSNAEAQEVYSQLQWLNNKGFEYLFTFGEFNLYMEKLESLKPLVLQRLNSTEDQLELTRYFSNLEHYIDRKFKSRIVQRTLYDIFTYAIFKKRVSAIDFAFSYHQPGDADASWGGNDLTFLNLVEILILISNTRQTQSDLMFYWPDRHGTPTYIKTLHIAFLKRWFRWALRQRQHASWQRQVTASVRRYYELDPEDEQERDGIVGDCGSIRSVALALIKVKEWPFKKGANFDEFTEFLDFLIEQLREIDMTSSS